jgi:pyroglutamyl-peptidase
MARPRILVTGFGPFPGFAENPSAWLVETLAAQERAPDTALDARILTTAWDDVALMPRLYRSLQPHAMIHFGVSAGAKAFHIEASAHNRMAQRADARGALPEARTIRQSGPARYDTLFPVAELAAHLRRTGIAARSSRSAGAYLCNFLYYHSLEWAHLQRTVPLVVFVHVPPWTKSRGPQSREALLKGATEILRFVRACANGEKPLKTKRRRPLRREADISARSA